MGLFRGFPSLWCTVNSCRLRCVNSRRHLAQISPWILQRTFPVVTGWGFQTASSSKNPAAGVRPRPRGRFFPSLRPSAPLPYVTLLGYSRETGPPFPLHPGLGRPCARSNHSRLDLSRRLPPAALRSQASFLGQFAALFGILFAHQREFLRIQAKSLEIFLRHQVVSFAQMSL